MGAGEKMLGGVAGNPAAQPNNGMHPTANSVNFIRKTPWLMRWMRGG